MVMEVRHKQGQGRHTSKINGSQTMKITADDVMRRHGELFYPILGGLSVPQGWLYLVDAGLLQLGLLEDRQGLQISDIKEKMGVMSILHDGGGADAEAIIEAVEEESARICVVCGKAGRMRPGLRVACDEHARA